MRRCQVNWRNSTFSKFQIVFIHMIPAYTSEQFESATSRQLLNLKCEYCHRIFLASKKDIQWALKCSYKNVYDTVIEDVIPNLIFLMYYYNVKIAIKKYLGQHLK